LDGVQRASQVLAETVAVGAALQPLILGAKSGGSSSYFKGQLDDLRFVPYALAGSQFPTMMQNAYSSPVETLAVRFTYDHQNRLISRATDPDGTAGPLPTTTEYFIHDGPGQSVTSANLDPHNLEQVGQIVLRLDETGAVTNRYLWGPGVDQLVADEQVTSPSSPGEVLWALTDHLGTVRDLVEYSGGTTQVVVHRTYDSFGNVTSELNPTAVDILFGYTGRPFDAATGLQNNLNRWYDPNVGRWISEDPVGFAAGDANLYRYVGNSPTNFIDPSGLFTVGISIGFEFNFGPINFGFQIEGHFGYDPYTGTTSVAGGYTTSGGVGGHLPFLGGAAGGGVSVTATNASTTTQLLGNSSSVGIVGTYSGNYISGEGYNGVEIGIPGLGVGWGAGAYGRGNVTCGSSWEFYDPNFDVEKHGRRNR
jgi:RHS repeat-associated protein